MPEGEAGARQGLPVLREVPEPPPFRIPAAHFSAGVVFLVLGAVALAWRSPASAAGAISDPGLIAATHLFTLGWISLSIMGALYQFLPVALGAPVRWLRLAEVTFVLWTLGVIAFAAGLATGRPALHLSGAGALGVAALCFASNVAFTLPAATRRGPTWWCVAGATGALAGAWVLGFLLAVNLPSGLLGESRFAVLAIHVHVAAGGWVLLTIIGVAHWLLPMFLRSHGASDLPGRLAAGLVGAATVALLLTGHLLPLGALRPALALMALGAGAFLLQAVLHFRDREGLRLDPGIRLVAAALVLLGLALATGLAILAIEPTGFRLAAVYGILLVPGALALFVAGHYYRIVPSFAWFHRFGPRSGSSHLRKGRTRKPTPGRADPRPAELFDHRLAHVAGGSLTAGVMTLALGAFLGHTDLCFAGASVFLVGAVVEAAQILSILRAVPTGPSYEVPDDSGLR